MSEEGQLWNTDEEVRAFLKNEDTAGTVTVPFSKNISFFFVSCEKHMQMRRISPKQPKICRELFVCVSASTLR
jgi:hypothetical protein